MRRARVGFEMSIPVSGTEGACRPCRYKSIERHLSLLPQARDLKSYGRRELLYEFLGHVG